MPELFDYRFRVKVHPDSSYGKLCRFLKAKKPDFDLPEFTENEMVLEASSAYCLPLAFKKLKEVGKCSEAELKHCGRISIYKLIQRVYLLAQVCGLEGELEVIPLLSRHQLSYRSNVRNRNETTSSYAVESLSIELPVNEDTDNDSGPRDLLHHQDDDTFGDLFGQQ